MSILSYYGVQGCIYIPRHSGKEHMLTYSSCCSWPGAFSESLRGSLHGSIYIIKRSFINFANCLLRTRVNNRDSFSIFGCNELVVDKNLHTKAGCGLQGKHLESSKCCIRTCLGTASAAASAARYLSDSTSFMALPEQRERHVWPAPKVHQATVAGRQRHAAACCGQNTSVRQNMAAVMCVRGSPFSVTMTAPLDTSLLQGRTTSLESHKSLNHQVCKQPKVAGNFSRH